MQVIFGLFITGSLHFLPDAGASAINGFSGRWTQESVTNMEEGAQDQIDAMQSMNPMFGAMFITFNSGFFILDFLLNSLLAIPQMFSILLATFFMFVPIDPWIQVMVQATTFTLLVLLYLWMLLSFIFSAVSGRVV